MKLLDAFMAYVNNRNFNNRSAVILTTVYASIEGFISIADLSYTEAIQNPMVFDKFTSGEIPILIQDTRVSNLTDFATSLGVHTPNNLR